MRGRLILILLAFGASAQPPRLIREQRLSAGGQPLRDVAFSPDGSQIAVLLGAAGSTCGQPDEIVLVPASGGLLRRIPAPCMMEPPWRHVLNWSAGGGYLAVAAWQAVAVTRLSDASRCEVPYPGQFAGFIDSTHVAAMRFAERPQRRLLAREEMALQVYGSDCRPDGVVAVPFRPHDVAAFAGPGLVLLCDPDEQAQMILRAPGGQAVARLRVPYHNHVFQFGDGGRVVCASAPPEGRFDLPTVCYDVASGGEIRPRPPIHNGAPYDLARDAPVLVAAGRSWWMVWNLRQGREMARLPRSGGRAALSPDGRRVAIACEDVLRLYELPR